MLWSWKQLECVHVSILDCPKKFNRRFSNCALEVTRFFKQPYLRLTFEDLGKIVQCRSISDVARGSRKFCKNPLSIIQTIIPEHGQPNTLTDSDRQDVAVHHRN